MKHCNPMSATLVEMTPLQEILLEAVNLFRQAAGKDPKEVHTL